MTQRPIEISPHAVSDLVDIHVYLHNQSPQSAEAFLVRFNETTELIALHPKIGAEWQRRGYASKNFRMLTIRVFRNYLILYRVHRTRISIERVVHGARKFL